jgi:hypothetical protein
VAIREIVSLLVARFDGQDCAIERFDQKLDRHGERLTERLANLERTVRKVFRFGRRIQPHTKAEHIDAGFSAWPSLSALSAVYHHRRGRAANPKCLRIRSFFTNQQPVEHTWLISKQAHEDLTYGRISREEAAKSFSSYQAQRKRLPGRQPGLFG